jgi:KDO2-lipid IV(A) lauroyltransferase
MPTHKKPESERFKGPVKYAEYLVARALVTVLQRVPIGLAYRLGRAVGWLAWLTMKRRRATVRKNLEIVNAWMDTRSVGEHRTSNIEHRTSKPSCGSPGVSPSSSLEAQVKEIFQRAGANLIAGFPLSRRSTERMEQHLQVEGVEHLRSALAQGKGCIILLAHMGPWEVLTQLPQLAAARGVTAPLAAMYRPLNNAYLDDWIRRQREAVGTRLFSRRDGFHKPVDFLRAGGVLGILSDQKMRQGPAVAYFGQEVHTSPIPGLFHRRSGAPMLALSMTSLATTRWKLCIESVEIPSETDLNDRASMATLCNQALENSLSQSPLDGFWLHKRF